MALTSGKKPAPRPPVRSSYTPPTRPAVRHTSAAAQQLAANAQANQQRIARPPAAARGTGSAYGGEPAPRPPMPRPPAVPAPPPPQRSTGSAYSGSPPPPRAQAPSIPAPGPYGSSARRGAPAAPVLPKGLGDSPAYASYIASRRTVPPSLPAPSRSPVLRTVPQITAANPELHRVTQRDYTASNTPAAVRDTIVDTLVNNPLMNNPIARGVQRVSQGGRNAIDRAANTVINNLNMPSFRRNTGQPRSSAPLDEAALNRPRLAEFLSSDDPDEQARVKQAYQDALRQGATPQQAKDEAWNKLGGVSQIVGGALTDPTMYVGGMAAGVGGRVGTVARAGARAFEVAGDPLGEVGGALARRAVAPLMRTGPFSQAMGIVPQRGQGPATPINRWWEEVDDVPEPPKLTPPAFVETGPIMEPSRSGRSDSVLDRLRTGETRAATVPVAQGPRRPINLRGPVENAVTNREVVKQRAYITNLRSQLDDPDVILPNRAELERDLGEAQRELNDMMAPKGTPIQRIPAWQRTLPSQSVPSLFPEEPKPSANIPLKDAPTVPWRTTPQPFVDAPPETMDLPLQMSGRNAAYYAYEDDLNLLDRVQRGKASSEDEFALAGLLQDQFEQHGMTPEQTTQAIIRLQNNPQQLAQVLHLTSTELRGRQDYFREQMQAAGYSPTEQPPTWYGDTDPLGDLTQPIVRHPQTNNPMSEKEITQYLYRNEPADQKVYREPLTPEMERQKAINERTKQAEKAAKNDKKLREGIPISRDLPTESFDGMPIDPAIYSATLPREVRDQIEAKAAADAKLARNPNRPGFIDDSPVLNQDAWDQMKQALLADQEQQRPPYRTRNKEGDDANVVEQNFLNGEYDIEAMQAIERQRELNNASGAVVPREIQHNPDFFDLPNGGGYDYSIPPTGPGLNVDPPWRVPQAGPFPPPMEPGVGPTNPRVSPGPRVPEAYPEGLALYPPPFVQLDGLGRPFSQSYTEIIPDSTVGVRRSANTPYGATQLEPNLPLMRAVALPAKGKPWPTGTVDRPRNVLPLTEMSGPPMAPQPIVRPETTPLPPGWQGPLPLPPESTNVAPLRGGLPAVVPPRFLPPAAPMADSPWLRAVKGSPAEPVLLPSRMSTRATPQSPPVPEPDIPLVERDPRSFSGPQAPALPAFARPEELWLQRLRDRNAGGSVGFAADPNKPTGFGSVFEALNPFARRTPHSLVQMPVRMPDGSTQMQWVPLPEGMQPPSVKKPPDALGVRTGGLRNGPQRTDSARGRIPPQAAAPRGAGGTAPDGPPMPASPFEETINGAPFPRRQAPPTNEPQESWLDYATGEVHPGKRPQPDARPADAVVYPATGEVRSPGEPPATGAGSRTSNRNNSGQPVSPGPRFPRIPVRRALTTAAGLGGLVGIGAISAGLIGNQLGDARGYNANALDQGFTEQEGVVFPGGSAGLVATAEAKHPIGKYMFGNQAYSYPEAQRQFLAGIGATDANRNDRLLMSQLASKINDPKSVDRDQMLTDLATLITKYPNIAPYIPWNNFGKLEVGVQNVLRLNGMGPATPTSTMEPATATAGPGTPTATPRPTLPVTAPTSTVAPTSGPSSNVNNDPISGEFDARTRALFSAFDSDNKTLIKQKEEDLMRLALQNPRLSMNLPANWKDNGDGTHPSMWYTAMNYFGYQVPPEYLSPPAQGSPDYEVLPTSNPVFPPTATPVSGGKVSPAPMAQVEEQGSGTMRPFALRDNPPAAPVPPSPYRDPGTQPGGPAATRGNANTTVPNPAVSNQSQVPAVPTAPPANWQAPATAPAAQANAGSAGGGGSGGGSTPRWQQPGRFYGDYTSKPNPRTGTNDLVQWNGSAWVAPFPFNESSGGGGGGSVQAPSYATPAPRPASWQQPGQYYGDYTTMPRDGKNVLVQWNGSAWVDPFPFDGPQQGQNGQQAGTAKWSKPGDYIGDTTVYFDPESKTAYQIVWDGQAWIPMPDAFANAGGAQKPAQPKWAKPGAFVGETTIYYDPAAKDAYQIVWDGKAWVPMPDPFAKDAATGPAPTVYDPPLPGQSATRRLPEGWAAWTGTEWVLTEDSAGGGGSGGGGYSGGGGGGSYPNYPQNRNYSGQAEQQTRFWGDLTPQDQSILRLYFAGNQGESLARAVASRLKLSLAQLRVMFDLAPKWRYMPTAPVRTRWMG